MTIKETYITTAIIALLAGLCIGLSGCSQGEFGAGEDLVLEKIDMEKEVIRIEKEQEKLQKGKYQYKPKYEKDKLKYEVHEYVTPKGEAGYQIFIEGEAFKKSIGYGVEAEDRTWEIQIDNNIATTTK